MMSWIEWWKYYMLSCVSGCYRIQSGVCMSLCVSVDVSVDVCGNEYVRGYVGVGECTYVDVCVSMCDCMNEQLVYITIVHIYMDKLHLCFFKDTIKCLPSVCIWLSLVFITLYECHIKFYQNKLMLKPDECYVYFFSDHYII